MIQNRLKELESAQEKYSVSHFGFLRNITTISVGLFGLLVSLKPKIITDYSAKIAFVITISCLGIGILFSIIAQYYDVYLRKEEKKARTENLYKALNQESTDSIKFLPEPKIFKVSKLFTFIFLGMSIISLIVYVFLIEFNLSN